MAAVDAPLPRRSLRTVLVTVGARFTGLTEALPPFEFPFAFPRVACLLGVLVFLPRITMLSTGAPVTAARALAAWLL